MGRKFHIVLAVFGALGVFAPEVGFIAAYLAATGVPGLALVSKALGWLVTLWATWPVISGKIQAVADAASGAVQAPMLPGSSDQTRQPNKGIATISAATLLGGIALLVALLSVLFWPMLCKADTAPQFGGCVNQGKVCFGPSATISVGQFNLSTSKFQGGVIPGVGYGVTLEPDQWYATGMALYASFLVGQGTANALTPSLMFSFANYVRLGAGVAITEQPAGPTAKQWLLLFGLGSDFGGSPAYVKQQAAAARAAQ